MSFEIFDYREDLKNLLVTPHIRARFLRIEPGEVHGMHSHDLGHEIFFILQGHLHFYIDGDEQIVGPGQLCFAVADEIHQVRNKGDETVFMYLSVTPHIQPTHTGRDPDGTRHATRFITSNNYDVETDATTPVEELIDRVAERAEKVAQSVRAHANAQKDLGEKLKVALTAGDEDEASRLRDTMWHGLRDTYKDLYSLSDVWNALAPRAGKVG
ncbi:MAG: cupin domain-containing protein [Candidatus Latescibacterota bacterium]|jgi:quercetin dioxygenase-like cupin family protein